MLPTRRSSGMVTLLLKQAWQAARTDSPSAPTMLMSSGNLGALGVSQSEPHLFVSDWKVSCEPDVRTCTLFTAAMPPACCSAGRGGSAGLPPQQSAARGLH